MAALKPELLPRKEDGSLQSCRSFADDWCILADLSGYALILGVFEWFEVEFVGFTRFGWISWGWRHVGALRPELLPPKEDGSLQSCRFGGFEGLWASICKVMSEWWQQHAK